MNEVIDCRKCGATKPIDEFRPTPKGRRRVCRECLSAQWAEWQRANPDKVNARNKRWASKNPANSPARSAAWRLANPEKYREIALQSRRKYPGRRHGLTPEAFAEMMADQDDRCAICRDLETRIDRYGQPQRLAIDHDHSTCHPGTYGCPQCVRGLLCEACNNRVDNVERGRSEPSRAISAYLEAHRSKRLLAG